MRKGLTITSMAGAVALAMSGSVFALGANGPTNGVTFGSSTYDQTTKAVGASYCGVGQVSCQVIASGNGFAQLQVTDATDANNVETFIHTIVREPNSTNPTDGTLGFTDETFVRIVLSNGATTTTNQNGLMGRQSITQDGFASTTNVATGWGNVVATDPTISIVQSLDDQGAADLGDEFSGFFGYQAITDADGVRQAFAMDIGQSAGLYQVSTGNGTLDDKQSFALRERSGTAFNGTTGTQSTVAGGDPINWSGTDDVKAIWIGQEVALPEANQTDRTQMAKSFFGFVSYENVTNTAIGTVADTEYASTSDINGLFVQGPGNDWSAVFNQGGVAGSNTAAPTLTAP